MLVAGLFFACLLGGLAGCKKDDAGTAPATNASSSGNPVTAPVDYLGAVSKGQQAARKTVQSAGVQQAIQMFYAQEGRYPKTLQELVRPDYLPSIPAPPAGMRYDYNPTNGTFRVVPK
jgi:hypothetical protein